MALLRPNPPRPASPTEPTPGSAPSNSPGETSARWQRYQGFWRERVCQTTCQRGHFFACPQQWQSASSGFNQLRNEFLTAARRVATTKKQAIGEVVEWASGGAFKYGDVGRMTEADIPKLRAATELMAQ